MDTENTLRHRLRALPVPPPAAGFAERVLAIARTADRPPWQPSRPVYALAASVALAVGLGIGAGYTQLDRRPAAEVLVATLAPGQAQQVRLTFTSPADLTGVTVHLQLPDGVELVGYSGRRELRWQVDLQAGANALDLPMIMKRGTGGVLTTQLSHGQDQRQFTVLVKSRAALGV
jgi:hypothetical protein